MLPSETPRPMVCAFCGGESPPVRLLAAHPLPDGWVTLILETPPAHRVTRRAHRACLPESIRP